MWSYRSTTTYSLFSELNNATHRVSVALRRTVCGNIDWRVGNLKGSHHHHSPLQDYTQLRTMMLPFTVGSLLFPLLWRYRWVQTIHYFTARLLGISFSLAFALKTSSATKMRCLLSKFAAWRTETENWIHSPVKDKIPIGSCKPHLF